MLQIIIYAGIFWCISFLIIKDLYWDAEKHNLKEENRLNLSQGLHMWNWWYGQNRECERNNVLKSTFQNREVSGKCNQGIL